MVQFLCRLFFFLVFKREKEEKGEKMRGDKRKGKGITEENRG